MHVHFIAIGGAVMHNLALALQKKGLTITGSDDEIYEPSRSRLKNAGLLPPAMGWFPDKINKNMDAVILGMHARADNPELLRAQELGLRIYSYPEFVYEQTKNKRRVVIGGSHGKTTVTSMIMHVLKKLGYGFDYLVGSQIEGFELMANLEEKNEIAVIEGDEYLASPIDRRPKFHLYQANIGLITGIAWDHINVFPTYAEYVKQFDVFAKGLGEKDHLVYCAMDNELARMVQDGMYNTHLVPYMMPVYYINDQRQTVIQSNGKEYPLQVFGPHNLMNIDGARHVCKLLGINDDDFYSAIADFKGAAKRLEPIYRDADFIFYRDFAHSPSKLKATTHAIREQFVHFRLLACMELHTFSSLNENFLGQYNGTLNDADVAVVYFNPQTIAHKKLKPISVEQVRNAFGRNDLQVFTDSMELKKYLVEQNMKGTCLLMMSSGTFDGYDFHALAKELKK